MTMQVDAWFQERYKEKVTHPYQPQGFLLQGMFEPQGRLEGKKAYWPKYDKMNNAGVKVRGVPAPRGNPAASLLNADLVTWESVNEVYDFDGVRMAPNEESALISAATMDLGRKVDAAIMSVLNTAAPTAGTGFIDTSAAQVKATDIALLLGQWMGTNDVPADGMIYGGISMLCHQALMGDSAYSNSQWVGGDLPFKQMGRTQGRTWNFVNWVILPDSYFNVPSANKMDMFIWHRPSFGWSNNKTISTEWARDIDKACWVVRHESEGCGVALRNEGVARLRIKTDLTSITKS